MNDTDDDTDPAPVTREVEFEAVVDGVHATTVISRIYPTAVDDLWDAVTNSQRLPRWFAPITGDLRPGGRYSIENNASGEVLACEPPRRFVVSWEFAGGSSEVVVSVEPVEAGARLRIVHSGDTPAREWAEYGPGAGGLGWDLALHGLDDHVRRATTTPIESTEWIHSAEARQFIADSSAGWGEAAIKAGAPADEARAAVARTAAFYRGD